MQRQNSTASQTDECETSYNARHSKKKEKYVVGMLIAEGNYAIVKQCKEKASNRHFVLRVINKAKVFWQEDLVNNELKIMKSLRHENILQVVDDWETSDEICLVLEQIEVGNNSLYISLVPGANIFLCAPGTRLPLRKPKITVWSKFGKFMLV